MAAPVIIEPIIQKAEGDCVITALAMILAVPYAEVCSKALALYPTADTKGMTTRQMLTVVRALGRNLQSVPIKDANLEGETGILDVRMNRRYHSLALFEGVVINPADGLIYNLETYLATKKATPARFFRP